MCVHIYTGSLRPANLQPKFYLKFKECSRLFLSGSNLFRDYFHFILTGLPREVIPAKKKHIIRALVHEGWILKMLFYCGSRSRSEKGNFSMFNKGTNSNAQEPNMCSAEPFKASTFKICKHLWATNKIHFNFPSAKVPFPFHSYIHAHNTRLILKGIINLLNFLQLWVFPFISTLIQPFSSQFSHSLHHIHDIPVKCRTFCTLIYYSIYT